MLSLAVTHFNRFELLREAVKHVQNDPRLDEIVIVDDFSEPPHYQQILDEFWLKPRFKIHRNYVNVDCYINKKLAVEYSRGPWVILFDSDNILNPSYIDALIAAGPWERDTAYLPVFAEPEFDYREFEGQTVDRHNLYEFIDNETFRTALNTANYMFHRDEYLRVWDGRVVPHTSDSIYQNFRWLEAGNRLYFVPGMTYYHRLHDGSHFVQNDHKTGEFKKKTETLLRMLR